MTETANIVEHIRRRIGAAEVQLDPFPHFVTTDLLPDAAYDEILANWPPQDLAKTNNWAIRRELPVATHLDEFPKAIRPTWRNVVEWTQVARDLVLQKLQPYVGYKFVPLLGQRRAAEMKLVTQRGPTAFLATYTGALSLFTHVDHPRLLTNSFLYVNEHNVEEPELGTVLYQSYGLALPSNTVKLPPEWEERYLRRAKTVPYARNLLLSYINTPSAFHGVDAADIGSRVRRLLMFSTAIDPQTYTPEEAKRLG